MIIKVTGIGDMKKALLKLFLILMKKKTNDFTTFQEKHYDRKDLAQSSQ